MKTRLILAIYSIMLLTVSLIPWISSLYQPGVTGSLFIDPANGNILHIDEYDLELTGIDKDGVTYFCIPAFINLTTIDMQASPVKLYLNDGSLLSRSDLWHIQDVTVDTGDGFTVPWKIEFMRSANLNSVFLELKDSDISSIDHDIPSPVSAKVYSPSGILRYSDENAMIKGRGNATWQTEYFEPEKKPYDLFFSDSIRIGNRLPGKKWTMLANVYEGTDMLNKMVLETACKLDMKYVSDSEWVDLYADGKYLGNYLLCSEPATSAASIIDAGGWLAEKNDVYYDEKPYGISTPHDKFTIRAGNAATDTFIDDTGIFINKIDGLMYSGTSSLNEYIDLNSFVRWYMLEEVFYNEDALISSCFFYKPSSEDILYAGPPWDFDNACGEAGKRFLNYEGSILDEPEYRHPLKWYSLLNEDPAFRNRLHKLFNDNLSVFDELISSGLEEYYKEVGSSAEMDRAIYGISGYGQDYTVPGYYSSVYNNFRYTKFFLYKRLCYLSDKWGTDAVSKPAELSDGSMHNVYFVFPSGDREQIAVPDGTQLSPADYPAYDTSKYDGWVYESNGLEASYYLPVFEDCTFILEEKGADL